MRREGISRASTPGTAPSYAAMQPSYRTNGGDRPTCLRTPRLARSCVRSSPHGRCWLRRYRLIKARNMQLERQVAPAPTRRSQPGDPAGGGGVRLRGIVQRRRGMNAMPRAQRAEQPAGDSPYSAACSSHSKRRCSARRTAAGGATHASAAVPRRKRDRCSGVHRRAGRRLEAHDARCAPIGPRRPLPREGTEGSAPRNAGLAAVHARSLSLRACGFGLDGHARLQMIERSEQARRPEQRALHAELASCADYLDDPQRAIALRLAGDAPAHTPA